MYAYVEEPGRARCDSAVQSLSWMGKAPDGQPEGGTTWHLTETSYYDSGWLAGGNTRGVIGVTLTSCRPGSPSFDQPARTNFNLRGHRSEVSICIHSNKWICTFLISISWIVNRLQVVKQILYSAVLHGRPLFCINEESFCLLMLSREIQLVSACCSS